jgi:hypothetical protein
VCNENGGLDRTYLDGVDGVVVRLAHLAPVGGVDEAVRENAT